MYFCNKGVGYTTGATFVGLDSCVDTPIIESNRIGEMYDSKKDSSKSRKPESKMRACTSIAKIASKSSRRSASTDVDLQKMSKININTEYDEGEGSIEYIDNSEFEDLEYGQEA